MQKHNHLILLFVVVSKCRLNVNSKLSINVTCNKARLKKILVLHLMIQMDMNSNDFTHPELAERLSAIVESRLIYRVRKN